MSAPKLSGYLKRSIIPILKRNLRKELNRVRNEVEFPKQLMVKWLESTYSLDQTQAKKAFEFIIADIQNDKRFVQKTGVPGKPFIFYPKKSKDSYGLIQDWKTKMGKKLNDTFKFGSDFGKDFHLGHGTSSLSAVEYRAVKAAQKLSGREGTEAVLGVINEELELRGTTVEAFADTVFTKRGGLRKTYNVFLQIQAADENLADAAAEKAVNTRLINALVQMAVEAESSPKPLDIIDNALEKSLRNKPVKAIRSASKAKASLKNNKKVRKGKKPSIVGKTRDAKGRFTSPISLMNLINARLHDVIRKNMGSPALNYQTGRFARSVRVTNISQTRQQQMTAFYTYMKSPYQTFERGYAQGSTQRDPRLLISKSIREAAAQIMGARFDIRTRRQ